MMIIRIGAASILITLGLLAPASAACIFSRDIDHTDRVSDTLIMFTMNDRSVYRNDLPVRCPNLKSSIDGFTIEPTDPSSTELCDGQVVIRLNDQGRASCILGTFRRVK